MNVIQLRNRLSPLAIIMLLLAIGLGVVASSTRATPTSAAIAKTLSVSEAASMHLVGHHGSALNEQGNATGSFNCPLGITLNVSYTTATITFTICHSGGSFSGSGKAAFYASGTSAHFEGTVRITRGTGKYAHASASGLRIVGSLQRKSYALTVKVTGQMHI